MVKFGGDSLVVAATASAHAAQPLSSPEWSFPVIARPRTKRAGTPFPERARLALKREGLESGSVVSRAKKKMIFEMAEDLFTGIHGEGSRSPEEGEVLTEKMLCSLAQMATPGAVEGGGSVIGRKVERGHGDMELGGEGESATDLELGESNQSESSGVDFISTTADCSGKSENSKLDAQTTVGGSMVVDGTSLEPASNFLEVCVGGPSKKSGPPSFLESQLHVQPFRESSREFSNEDNSLACDISKENDDSQVLKSHASVSPLLAKNNLESHGHSIHYSDNLSINVEHPYVAGEIWHGTCTAGHPPESVTPPEADRNLAEFSAPKQQHNVITRVGAAANNEDGSPGRGDGVDGGTNAGTKADPVNLDADQTKSMGTSGSSEGVPLLCFSNEETKLLADKIGYAIVGKFSHTIPSPRQIQKSLSHIQFVDGFKWKFMNAKHILIQFRDVCDYARMLNGPNGVPVWHMEHHPMRVFKWTPDFDTFFESPIAAVWCKVIGIPIHLFDQSALLAIGKLLGKPIQADHATINQTRLSFARICVEIDISIPPPEEIIINFLGKDTRYKVVWDRIPLFCVECKHVGHAKEACHALGKYEKSHTKGQNRYTRHTQPDHVPSFNRKEWRPKGKKANDTSSTLVRSDEGKGEVSPGKQEETKETCTSPTLQNKTAPQVEVDEDGFQVVSKRRKGNSNFPLTHGHESSPKHTYLEKLLQGGNVATVSFKETNVGVIDPGGGPSVSLRGGS